ncbi:MAG: PqqD family protein [Clostridia bacterium]|nr:PqqD family protein [Clostridia bacterium]
MKLKDSFITQDIDGTQFMVAVGETSFTGIVRSNKTAAFIVDCLKTETTKEQIVDKMCAKYDAPRERIEADVEKILEKLRGIGALDE